MNEADRAKARYAERKAQGLCVVCGGSKEARRAKRTKCQACSDIEVARVRAKKSVGFCSHCGKPAESGMTMCERHLAMYRSYRRSGE